MSATFNDLVELMDRLRSPGGCPWDREQTYATLAPMLLEEAYEAFDALEEAREGRPAALREELGDLLFQITFFARVAKERVEFNIDDVIGDLLFVITNIARQLSVEPEAALKLSNRKFRRRFRYIETMLRERKRKFDETTLEELEELWQEAKKEN